MVINQSPRACFRDFLSHPATQDFRYPAEAFAPRVQTGVVTAAAPPYRVGESMPFSRAPSFGDAM
jgi:hypothetical protein